MHRLDFSWSNVTSLLDFVNKLKGSHVWPPPHSRAFDRLGMAAIFNDEVSRWCDENIVGDYMLYSQWTETRFKHWVEFENERDLVLFKTFWC